LRLFLLHILHIKNRFYAIELPKLIEEALLSVAN
jgi:hypothetical protein